MGKGYNNYMCKKPFHPGSKANIKRAWMAEQKTENEKKKQEELKFQYEKEQDLYNNRALISSESKDKLELNFMYEAPPGAKRERQKEDDEPEFKFEWQRKYNAPREDYAKGNEDIKDQPFGIPVRNVRCIKCHKWGHINTDKECPLYNQASTSSMPTTSMDPMELMRQMKEDGFGLKENVLGHQLNPAAANQQFIPSDESDPEMDFLKSLSTAEKKKLLRKLKKLSKKQEKKSNCKKKKSKKSKKSKAKDSSSSDEEKVKRKKKHKKSSSSESDSSSSDESEKRKSKKTKKFDVKSDEKRMKKTKKSRKSSDSESDYDKEKKIKKSKKTKKSSSSESDSSSEDRKRKKTKTPDSKDNNSKMKDEKSSKIINSKILKSPSRSTEHIDCKEKSSRKNKEKNFENERETDEKNHHQKMKEEIVKNSPSKQKHKVSEEKMQISTETDKLTEEKISMNSAECEVHETESKKFDEMALTSSNKRKLDVSESENSNDTSNQKKTKFNHPDGFSHLCPQAHVKENYLPSSEEYKGNIHDKFRHHNRDKRSPSVKQKYNK